MDMMMYGFGDAQVQKMERACLGSQEVILRPVEVFTHLVAIYASILVIGTDALEQEELEDLLWLHDEGGFGSQRLVFIGQKNKVRVKSTYVSTYERLDDFLEDLDYLILSTKRSEKKVRAFSRTLANSLSILKMIRSQQGITTHEMADRLELSRRSILRYIETLRVAGEWIEYDRQAKGWTLLEEGHSILLGDVDWKENGQ